MKYMLRIWIIKGFSLGQKETTVNKKTSRYNKKKRFGKNHIANKAPSMFFFNYIR